jgi:hypothetical protein
MILLVNICSFGCPWTYPCCGIFIGKQSLVQGCGQNFGMEALKIVKFNNAFTITQLLCKVFQGIFLKLN